MKEEIKLGVRRENKYIKMERERQIERLSSISGPMRDWACAVAQYMTEQPQKD